MPSWPAGHRDPAADTAPLLQPKPSAALQFVQLVEPRAEYRPGAHKPLQVDTIIPVSMPNEPASHGLHVSPPSRLYVPAPQPSTIMTTLHGENEPQPKLFRARTRKRYSMPLCSLETRALPGRI
jgi:hypothetical protein